MNSQKGQALPIALVILAAGILIIAPFLGYASSNVTGSQTYGQSITEQYSADAGVEYAIWSLQNGELDVPEFALNNNTVNVTIEYEGEGSYKITSVASGDDGSSITIEATVLITLGFFDGDYTIFDGNFSLGKGDIHTGDIYVKGDIQLDQGAVINGSVYAEGDIQLDQGAVINGNVYAQGNVHLDQGATINGDICAEKDVQLDQEAVINGNVYAQGNVHLDQGATINGDVYAGGDVQLDQGATITGDYPLPYEGCPLFDPASIDILTWEITPQSS